MANWFPPALAIFFISLYGALGWQQLVAGNRLVAPSSASRLEQQQTLPGSRFSFDRGGRSCATPTWRG